jgi:acyl-CoA thioester hydrolase
MTRELLTPIRVRFRDLDALGHVNYAVYLTYLEEASNALWEAVTKGVGRKLVANELGYVSARAEIDYRGPAYCGETLDICVWITAIGRSSFTTAYRITESGTGRPIASAKTVQVVTLPGPAQGEMPDEIRTALREYLVEAPRP